MTHTHSPLRVAAGSLVMIERRVREIGAEGLTLWTQAGREALREQQAREAARRARFERALEASNLPGNATRGDLQHALAHTRRAISSALLVAVVLSSIVQAGDDDLVRRAPRGRSRRRDEQAAVADGETGEIGGLDE